jgi:pre-mRNA-splicing factor 38A
MANRTAKDVQTIKGTNPQFLIEKIIRLRIYDSPYWKEDCFALTGELLVDKAMGLNYVGGVYGGNIKPTPFLCLILKMLQIQPHKDIVVEFIKNQEYKYVRALGAFYLRITGTAVECYNYLEPLYNDYRKLRRRLRNGDFDLVHMDEFIDELLHMDRSCDVIMPRIQKRYVLEQNEKLEPRVSALEEDLSDIEEESEDEELIEEKDPSPDYHRSHHSRRSRSRSRSRDRHRRRSYSPHRRRSRSRSPRRKHRSPSPSHEHRHRHKDKKRKRSRSRDRGRDRGRSRSYSPSSRKHKSKHSRSSKEDRKKRMKEEDEEIKQANELRAKLGLKPLRVD